MTVRSTSFLLCLAFLAACGGDDDKDTATTTEDSAADTADTAGNEDTGDTAGNEDTGDTADTADTGDTTDTADTGDTTDTADTGDTTDTSATDYAASFGGMNSLWYDDAYTFGDPRTWTFEFWFYPNDFSRAVRLMEWLNGGATDGRTSRGYWVIDVDAAGRVAFGSEAASSSGPTSSHAVYSTRSLTVGTWSHVAVVVDSGAGTIEFFIDGTSAGGSVPSTWFATTLSTSHQLGVGGRSTMAANGKLDNVRMWNVARTEAEIVADMNTTFDAATAPTSLVDQFDFNADYTSMRGNLPGESYMVTREPR